MVKRLGLARRVEDPLSRCVAEAGWEPVSLFLTEMVPTGTPIPLERPVAAIVLSPAGARAVSLPEGLPVVATGEGTAAVLTSHDVISSPQPRAEGLWNLLQERFPEGGDFLLIRGERSRGFLEEASRDTRWRLVPWITHAEKAKDPSPEWPQLDAVLALSPLQAELMGPDAKALLRFAWGERTAEAFRRAGFPAHGTCLARSEALGRMLAPYVQV
jgi:uroporphyrinogen-III synthase